MKVCWRHRDRGIKFSGISTYIGNDAPPCNLAQLADAVKVTFTTPVYKTIAQ